MTPIEQIKYTIQKEFQSFNLTYKSLFLTENPLLQSVFEQLSTTRGKQIRPTLVLLTAKLCGQINQKTILSASTLELLHTISLLHDDVVDNTFRRRGEKTINAVWGNQTAVLSGDYLLAKVMEVCFDKIQDNKINQCLSNLTRELSDGELWQLYYASEQQWNEANYYQTIYKKTAVLFLTCTQVAALSVNAAPEIVDKLTDFGRYLGLCFQIRDDIFDYSPDLQTGKPAFNDIREGKITLPLIHTMIQANEEERRYINRILWDEDLSPEKQDFLLKLINQKGGIEYAMQKMDEFRQKAFSLLDVFPSSEAKQALIDLTNYIAERQK